jgi:hypothetical protein
LGLLTEASYRLPRCLVASSFGVHFRTRNVS